MAANLNHLDGEMEVRSQAQAISESTYSLLVFASLSPLNSFKHLVSIFIFIMSDSCPNSVRWMLDLYLANKKQTAARFSCGLFILFFDTFHRV